jgi:hypothetical protein
MCERDLAPELWEISLNTRSRLHWSKICSKWEREWEKLRKTERKKVGSKGRMKIRLKMEIILPNSEIFIALSHFSQSTLYSLFCLYNVIKINNNAQA